MHQICRAADIVYSTKDLILEQDVKRFLDKHPDMALAHVVKCKVPGKVVGSPQYFRRKLAELLAMRQKFGIPSFFIALTAEEFTDTRWRCYDDLHSILRRFDVNWSGQDDPVACVRIFKEALDCFMKEVKQGDVIGKLLHYLIRLEVQHRGSPHSHILFWVDQADVDRSTNEILGCVPAHWDDSMNEFVVPEVDSLRTLFFQAMQKMIHVCHPQKCCKDGYCKYGFPMPPNYGGAIFEEDRGRWSYHRPGEQHRNVMPYHPGVLLLWGAHANVERVSNSDWSYYMLKYIMKMDSVGPLSLSTETADKLGFQNLTEAHRQLLSSMVFCQLVSATDAALYLLDVPLIESDCVFERIDSSPPENRSCRPVYGHANLQHPVERYCRRPRTPEFESMTFTQYWRSYRLLQKKLQSPPVAEDLDRRFVYPALEHHVVVFSDYHPKHNPEAFFYQQLLYTVPFGSETVALLCRHSRLAGRHLQRCSTTKVVIQTQRMCIASLHFGGANCESSLQILDSQVKSSKIVIKMLDVPIATKDHLIHLVFSSSSSKSLEPGKEIPIMPARFETGPGRPSCSRYDARSESTKFTSTSTGWRFLESFGSSRSGPSSSEICPGVYILDPTLSSSTPCSAS